MFKRFFSISQMEMNQRQVIRRHVTVRRHGLQTFQSSVGIFSSTCCRVRATQSCYKHLTSAREAQSFLCVDYCLINTARVPECPGISNQPVRKLGNSFEHASIGG